MIDYAEAKRMTTRHKGALTRARKTGDPYKVVAACDAFFADFAAKEWSLPDSWHTWNIARDHALYEIEQREWTYDPGRYQQ